MEVINSQLYGGAHSKCSGLINGYFVPFFTILLLLVGFSSFSQERPNFILILTDDQGWTSTSVQMDDALKGSKSDFYQTPNIERLSEAGMRFTRGYAPAAICSPSRRSIQFGQSPARQGDLRFKSSYHPDSVKRLTIPTLLKSVDPAYRTAHYGKWDMRAEIFPEDLGYDESDGDTGNRDGNMNSNSVTKWTDYFLNSNPKKIESLTGRAVNFMSRQVKSGHPFFLQVSHYATHVDIQAKEETFEKYWKRDPGKIHGNPGFAAMTEDLDDGIGIIIDAVEALGIADQTYLIFMSDNGGVELIPQTNEKMIPPSEYGRVRRNFPLRGGKWTLYEGGLRVPFIVVGPGIKAGSQTEMPVTGWDILPTLADLAGYKEQLPEDLDGQSFKNLLQSPDTVPGSSNRSLIFHRYNDHYPHSAIIQGDYKLVKHWKSNTLELFDLSRDVGETVNLAGSLPEKSKELYKTLIDYLKGVDAEILKTYNP